MILAALVLAVAAAALIDYLFRLPTEFRMAAWALGLVALGLSVVKHVWPAFRFSPSLTEIALRVERTEPGRAAGLPGVLASALELSHDGAGAQAHAAARESLLERAAAGVRAIRPSALLRSSADAQRGTVALLVALVPVLAAAVLAPELTWVAAHRILTPWTGADWPKRTLLAHDSPLPPQAFGSAVPLRAVVLKTDRPKGQTDVTGYYRLVVDDTAGPVTRVLLTPQAAYASRNDAQGEIFEHLLSPETLRLSAQTLRDASKPASALTARLEYWFESADDATPQAVALVAEPPAIAAAVASVSPPAYARGTQTPTVASTVSPASPYLQGPRELPVLEHRPLSVGPILQGSTVTLELTLTKPVPIGDGAEPTPDWLASTFGPQGLPAGATLRADSPDRWTLSWTAGDPSSLSIALTDSLGLRSPRDVLLAFDTVPDRVPTAAVVDPPQDESVLSTALLPASAEGRDDVALASVALEAQKLSPTAGSPGAPPEPVGVASSIASATPADGAPAAAPLRATVELNLADFDLSPGDELHLVAVAADAYEIEGQRHEPTRSAPRRLRVISDAQFTEQVLADLAALRPAAARLDQDQAELERRSSELVQPGVPRDAAETARARQDQVSERLDPAADLLRRLEQRLDRNAFPDQSLRGMLDQAQQAVEQAARASDRAAEELAAVARTPEGQAVPPEQAQELRDAQREVRDRLSDLISVLDRGQEGFAARQQVERLLADQRQVTAQTRALGEQTAGKSAEQLTPQERAELQRLAQQQEDLARRTDQAARALDERAQRAERTDPAQAAAMRRAADAAREQQASADMRRAGEQIEDNQTGAANRAQQEAEQALEQMLEQLDQAQQRRDEALSRLLEDLRAAISALVQRQAAELAALSAAAQTGEWAGLDTGMIALHQNTLAVADSSDAREVEPIVERLDAAARHQDAAISSLRDVPDAPAAEQAERMSLQRLAEALELADEQLRQADQRQTDREREQLRKAYQEALKTQLSVTGDTAPFVAKELSRRDKNAVRLLAKRQSDVRNALRELREKSEGFADAPTFRFAHDQLDRRAAGAADPLSKGEAPAAVGADQAAVAALLESLIDALAPDSQNPEFRDSEGDDGGGGGGGGSGGQPEPLVPDIAQLKLLRALQRDAARRTRELADGRTPAEARERELTDLADLQRQLADQAKALLDSLQNRGGPDPAEGPPPVPDAEPNPPPEAPR